MCPKCGYEFKLTPEEKIIKIRGLIKNSEEKFLLGTNPFIGINNYDMHNDFRIMLLKYLHQRKPFTREDNYSSTGNQKVINGAIKIKRFFEKFYCKLKRIIGDDLVFLGAFQNVNEEVDGNHNMGDIERGWVYDQIDFNHHYNQDTILFAQDIENIYPILQNYHWIKQLKPENFRENIYLLSSSGLPRELKLVIKLYKLKEALGEPKTSKTPNDPVESLTTLFNA